MDKVTLSQIGNLVRKSNIRYGFYAWLGLSFLQRINRWISRKKSNNYITDKSWNWKSEIVVVTGGSSGIGAQVVAKLSKENIKVIIVDLSEPRYKMSSNTAFYKADLSVAAEIITIAERIRNEHGHPTVLINNAGIGNALPILELSEPKLRKVFDMNMIAPILLVQQFLPNMIQRNHGHVVNIASMASFATQASNVDYACTKAGLLSFHEGLSQELRHIYNAPMVRTSILHPTWVNTPLIANLVKQGKLKGTVVSAEEVAGRVVERIYSGYGQQVVIPENLGWISMLRGFPGWLQEKMRDVTTLEFLDAMRRSQSVSH